MTLLIDNFDSFSYNLYQYVGEMDKDVRVIRNNEFGTDEIKKLCFDRIIISPGPGRPENAGNIIDVIRVLGKEVPILGVCLGHQAVCMAYGGSVGYAKKMMHGKHSVVEVDTGCPLFEGLGDKITVARYHSLAAEKDSLPKELKVTAVADDGEIMGVMHEKYPVYGVQFHPESIMTPRGHEILERFLKY